MKTRHADRRNEDPSFDRVAEFNEYVEREGEDAVEPNEAPRATVDRHVYGTRPH